MSAEEGKHKKVTQEDIDRARARFGKTWSPTKPLTHMNTQSTRDSIRHYCEGIGDTNPLYTDPAYAKKTRYGGLIAPPTFLYSVYWPCGQGITMRGVHSWHSGNEWEFYKPLRENDDVTFEVTPTDMYERPSTHAGRIWQAFDETIYKNQKGEIVAKAKGWTTLAERDQAGEKGTKRHEGITQAKYTPEDIEKINQYYENEVIRGSNPRYWEDVEVGEEMTPLVKGPLSLRDIVCFQMGSGTLYYKAHKYFYEFHKRHPDVGMLDSTTGLVDIPELVHIENSRAAEIGVPLAYDYGPQRMSWLSNLVTHWMGDDGWLKKLGGSFRRFNLVSDTQWIKGKVVKKYIEGDEHLVDCEIWAENQRGEVSAPGNATVVLPSRKE